MVNEKAVDHRLTTGLGQHSASLHVDHTDHNPIDDDGISFNLQIQDQLSIDYPLPPGIPFTHSI